MKRNLLLIIEGRRLKYLHLLSMKMGNRREKEDGGVPKKNTA